MPASPRTPKKVSTKAAKKTASSLSAKKAAVKKKPATNEEKPTGYKYADKSAGQPELPPVFDTLKALLMPYVKGSVVMRGGSGGQVALVSEKEIWVEGKKRPELHFAAVLIQKGYVGFYFMPVYSDPEKKELFAPELLKLLKGKACFHIKKLDEVLVKHIKDALKKGHVLYKEKGWV